MFRTERWTPALAAVLVAAAALSGCEDSEVIAPDGSTITLTANPAQILLEGGVQRDPVDLIATVRNELGVALPGQDVRFTTTAGTLSPTAGNPVSTDDFGNAMSVLNGAERGPQITATSGKATASLTLNALTCDLTSLAISPSPITVNNCTTQLSITVLALNSMGVPCEGVLITFANVATATPAPSSDIMFTFVQGSVTTDENGEGTVQMNLPGDCQDKCGGKICTGSVQATSGTTKSTPATPINDQVP